MGDWRSLAGVDPGRLRAARLAAHFAAQWLARIARGCVPPRANDFHTNLGWNDAERALATHAWPGGGRAGLKIADLTLVIWDRGHGMAPPALLRLDGRREADVREWLGGRLRQLGLDPDALDAPAPYQMPAHPLAEGVPYAAEGLAAALDELAAWFGNGDLVLNEVRQRIKARGLEAPPVRCWPHHFDLDSLISLGSGAAARTVGLGFSPGDEYYDQPYFYVSCHPPPDVATLPSLPPAGHWHSHHFTAAIAPADRILEAGDQQAAAETFLRAATDILIA